MAFPLFNLGPVKQRDCGTVNDLRQQEWAVIWLSGRRYVLVGEQGKTAFFVGGSW